MKPLRVRLTEKQKQLGLPWEIIERDYILSWILFGITKVAALRDILAFKGGTALKKCYFGDYRCSEDLDFTCLGKMPDDHSLEIAMKEVCQQAMYALDPYSPIQIFSEPYRVGSPHPNGQQAFDIRSQFPWHRSPLTHVIVEITADEKLVTPIVNKSIIHDYDEPLDATILTYSIEEIITEKLRAILQNIQTLAQKGWVRSRARDYYDLWRILTTYKQDVNILEFKELLHQKCKVRNVDFVDYTSFFSTPLLEIVEKSWEQWLQPLLTHVPPFNLVINELRDQIKSLLD